MDKATYWSSKPRQPSYHAITFAHSAFAAPIRLVANVFEAVTLAGNVHQPAPMQINPPQVTSDGQPKLRLSFPRRVVGRQFKAGLAAVRAAGTLEPIVVTYAVFLADKTAPEVTWTLYASDAGGVSFGAETVQVDATLDNPMRRAVAPIYLPTVFTGLKVQ